MLPFGNRSDSPNNCCTVVRARRGGRLRGDGRGWDWSCGGRLERSRGRPGN